MTKTALEIKNLTYRYPNQTHDSLKNINLTIKAGDWVSLVGLNGSGKSTLAKLIVGLLEDTSQAIQVFGKTMNLENGNAIRSQIGMVFQNPENQFVSSTVRDDVSFGLENQGLPRLEMKRRVQEALQAVGMENFINHAPSQLSGGQKQRVALAGALVQNPQLLILDEATSMLDPQTRQTLLQVVQKLHDEVGTTVLAITHDINETLQADQIVLLNQGEIVSQGKPSQIYPQTNLLAKCGLTVPLSYQVQQTLRKKGLALPTAYLDEKELIEQLWKLS